MQMFSWYDEADDLMTSSSRLLLKVFLLLVAVTTV